MSYIYDSFPTREAAERFAFYAQRRTGAIALIYDSQAASDEVDPFPFRLVPPIVLVSRTDDDADEQLLWNRAAYFGGKYQGT